MPRVKIDYVVSFSSEDPEHPASNLLQREVSKKKWLCMKGETSCSVVLQLARAVKISGVHIGAHHAALVEVLVARSETSGEQFQVLVPSSTFVSRDSSRREAGVQRVRSFGAGQLSAARDQRWDRVRVVCSQPYNKHCKYGLSFVHIDEAEGSAATAEPLRPLAFETFSSDEDDFKPGELFAKHLQKTAAENLVNSSHNTGAQIRQATSQALKNISESSTKLTKAVIIKPSPHRPSPAPPERPAHRARDQLLNDRGLRGLGDHASCERAGAGLRQKDTLNDSGRKRNDEAPKQTPGENNSVIPPRKEMPPHKPNTHDDRPPSDHNRDSKTRKRRRSDSPGNRPGPVSSEPHTLLAGAVLVLSGYENPRRAQLRNTALALGARVQRDWGPGCTHLICAFPSTPKLRALRAGGGAAPAARGEWLQQVSARRRLLPWAWFATEPARRRSPPPVSPLPDSEGDTDDEIEKVLREQKKRRLADPGSTRQANDVDVPPSSPPDVPGRSPPAPDDDGGSTEDEASAPPGEWRGGALPALLGGRSVLLRGAAGPRARMARYVRAYGGVVLDESTLEDDTQVDFVVLAEGEAGQAGRGGREVTPAWLARCHAARSLLPP